LGSVWRVEEAASGGVLVLDGLPDPYPEGVGGLEAALWEWISHLVDGFH